MPSFIDSHAHLDDPRYDADRDLVIERAVAAGVELIINIGNGETLEHIERSALLAAQHERIWATAGVHPHDASKIEPHWWPALRALLDRPKVVAVGETGLDYHYDRSPRDVQKVMFEKQIELALDRDMPVVCHIRDAHEEAAEILRTAGQGRLKGVIHCFTGGPADAARYVDLGFYISFSGIITFGKTAEGIRQAAIETPLDRILVETDSPYLSPAPMRGKRNEPAHVVHTAALIADAKGITLDALSQATLASTRQLFALPC